MTMRYKFKRRPYHHQKDALLKLIGNGYGGALLMAPRTGKTQVGVDYASILHQAGKVNRVLIVCPVSVIDVWEDEIRACCPVPFRIVVWDRKGRKRRDLPAFGRDVLDFVIVNYDAFSTPGRVTQRDENGAVLRRSKTRGGRYEAMKAFKAWQPQLMILDESHRIKSPSARKTRALRGLGKVVPYKVIATGTAVTKKKRVFDIYAQWKFLNPEGWIQPYTLAVFKEEFGRWRNMGNYERFIANRNLPKLRKLIHQDAFAVERDECFDLPASRPPQIHRVELEGETARLYDDMAEWMIAKLESGEITEAQIRLVQMLRLAQLTSGIARTQSTPTEPKGKLIRVGREKLRLLEDRLSDLFEADEKVVVAARWRADLASVVEICKKLKVPCFELHGGIKRQDRAVGRKKFQTLDGPACFAMQPAAGALGIDLSASATMIWLSLTNSYVDWDQCCQRIALAPRGTVIEYIIAKGTVDEVMLQGLMEDRDIAKMITESPDRLRRNYKGR